MRTYRASGIAPLPGVFIALIAAFLSAIIMGVVLYAADRYTGIYSYFAFPAVVGGVTGFTLSKAIRIGKIRNTSVAAILGLIAAITLFGTYYFAKYQLELKDDTRQYLISNNLPVTNAAIDVTTDDYLKSEVSATGFVGFLLLEAREGFSITSIGSSNSSRGLEIKGVWYWIHTAFEFFIVLALAASIPWWAAKEPFNEGQQQWYGDAQVILSAPAQNAKPLETALKAGQFEAAGALLQRQGLSLPRVEFAVKQTLIKDPENVVVTASLVKQNGKNEFKTKFATGLVSQAELERVLSGAVVTLEPAVG